MNVKLDKRINQQQLLFVIIGGLMLVNILTVVFFLFKSDGANETVATVGKQTISRQDWLNALEAKYGKDVLSELIDQKVIEEKAKKYNIKVSDDLLNRELTMMKLAYGYSGQDEETWKEQVRLNLLLEEMVTKDVIISEEAMKQYYEEKRELFQIPNTYHLSQIVVKTKSEAERTMKELKEGSSFSVLAKEVSIDGQSANQGGDIGYINENNDQYPVAYLDIAKKLETGKWSKPIQTDNGYAILYLHEKIVKTDYSYKQVKDYIHRKLALEQANSTFSAKDFWKETGVDWFYGVSGK